MLYSTEEFLSQLKARLNKSKPRTSVEEHLKQHLVGLNRTGFRPSLFGTFKRLSFAFCKPLPLVMLFLASIAIINTTQALLSEDTIYFNAKQAGMIYEELSDDDDFSPFANVEISSDSEDSALISFISGIIAVYRPGLKDAGAVASDIVAASRRAEVDPLYIAAIVSVESRFLNTAKSRVGALGLMQLMPRTAAELAENIAGKKAKPKLYDRKTNLRLGIRYVKSLNRKYKGNQRYALGAYNWGMGKVDKHRRKKRGKMPKGVEKYAATIVARTKTWRKHFDDAFKSVQIYASTNS